MADFVAVLKKTIDGMGETTPQMRARVYDKARSTIAAKLAAIVPPPPEAVAARQKRALEDAIATVEQGYAKLAPPPAPANDPLAELENIFSSIDRNKNQPNHVRPQPSVKAEPVPPPTPVEAPAAPSRKAPPPAVAAPAASTPVASTPVTSTPVAAPTARRPQASTAEPSGAVAGVRTEEFPALPADGPEADVFQELRSPRPARRSRGLIAAVVALVVVAGGAYGVWLNAGAFKAMLGSDETKPETVKVEPLAPAKSAATEEPAATPPTPAANAPAAAAADSGEAPKFTQRLTSEGKEVDPGPAGGENTIGEGTSVVALTTQPPAPAASAPAAPGTEAAAAASPTAAPAAPEQPAVAVGQKAIFYEERTNVAQGSAEPGNIVWSLVQESPGGDAPPEPAIRAEANIPGKNVQLRMTIRRNADETLPASHIIELIFLTPDGFEGGGIDNILRVAMKTSEQDAGNPLIGIPAKIADGFFLVALNDTKADEQANLTLLRNQDWIDIPVVYKSGRRALITMEKGIPGDKVFDEALKAWQEKSAG
jgi:hypothetical protein